MSPTLSPVKRLLAVPVAVALLAGCSSGAKGTVVSQSFPNPVSIIDKAGCVHDSSIANGDLSLAGDFMTASCDFPSGESIRVKTFKTANAKQSELDAGSGPQDGQATLVGPDWVMYVNGVHDITVDNGGYTFDPTVLALQALVGGVVK